MSIRSIYTSGKSQVLSLPPDWAKTMIDKYKGEVLIRKYGDMLLILPSVEYFKYRRPTSFEVKDHDSMVERLFATYLVGAEELSLRVSPEDGLVDAKLAVLKDYLYGMTTIRESETEILVKFNPPSGSIIDLLDREFRLYQAMQKLAFSQMESYPTTDEHPEEQEAKVENYERNLDSTSFQIRRALIGAVYDPQTFMSLELEHPGDILGYYRVENNLERLGDLQAQIFSEVGKLRKVYQIHKLQTRLDPLIELYRSSHSQVLTAFLERKNLYELGLVIRGKIKTSAPGCAKTPCTIRNEIIDWLTKESVKIMRELSATQSKPLEPITEMFRSLWSLESKLFGMVGNASNISEAWLCMLSRI